MQTGGENQGDWQWMAECGADTGSYFRIFNFILQSKEFDSSADYIDKWISEAKGHKLRVPIFDHKEAKERALSLYKKMRAK